MSSLSEVVQLTYRNSWVYAQAAFCQSLSTALLPRHRQMEY